MRHASKPPHEGENVLAQLLSGEASCGSREEMVQTAEPSELAAAAAAAAAQATLVG